MKKKSVCVLCGEPWVGYSNVCVNKECGGFCSWGEKKDGPPSSWNVSKQGKWSPKPVPKEVLEAEKKRLKEEKKR